MQGKAIAKTLRSSAHKVRLVADLVRGKTISQAEAILKNNNRKGSRLISKVLNSSVANAVNNFNLDKEKLFVSEIYINDGPIMKRNRMGSRGHVDKHYKRTCHITVIVKEKN